MLNLSNYKQTLWQLAAVLALVLLPLNANADEDAFYSDGSRYVDVSLVSDLQSFQPGATSNPRVGRVGLYFKIEPGWHIYWKNSGEAALPTNVSWELPPGWSTGELNWPIPTQFIEKGDILTYGYRREVLLFTDLISPNLIENTESDLEITAKVQWLVCKNICVPGRKTLSLNRKLSMREPLEPSEHYSLFDHYSALVPQPLPAKYNRLKLVSTTVVAGPSEEFPLAIRFDLSLSNTTLKPSEIFQIFPENNPALAFGRPQISLATDSAGQFAALLPFRVSSENEARNHSTIQGALAISKNFIGTPSDLATPWNVVLSFKNGSPDKLDKTISSALTPLTFRQISLLLPEIEQKEINTATEESFNLSSFLLAVLSGFVAGMILNLMPCVLPVISIKVMGFLRHANSSRAEVLRSASMYSLGILLSFAALAVTILFLQQLGHQLGWGFQFQHPEFVVILTGVVFLLALAFFEVFEFDIPGLQSACDTVDSVKHPLLKNFFEGVLATALATPCTAPFLGTALTYAFLQPPAITMAIFLSIGCGLAFPYLYLATHPKLVKLMPKPGAWMCQLKELMGFFLLGTVAWLLFVLHSLTEDGAIWMIVLMLLMYFSLWLRHLLRQTGHPAGARLATIIAVAFLMSSGFLLWPRVTEPRQSRLHSKNSLISWSNFSEELIQNSPQSVFIDFTAQWCITCKFNEKLVIESQATADAIKKYNILAVRADWTRGEKEISDALKKYGGRGVPHYVVIPAKSKKAIVLPTLLQSDTLIEAFAKAASE